MLSELVAHQPRVLLQHGRISGSQPLEQLGRAFDVAEEKSYCASRKVMHPRPPRPFTAYLSKSEHMCVDVGDLSRMYAARGEEVDSLRKPTIARSDLDDLENREFNVVFILRNQGYSEG